MKNIRTDWSADCPGTDIISSQIWLQRISSHFQDRTGGILDQQVNVQNCAKFVSGWTVQFLFHSFTIFHQIYLGLHQDIRK